MHLTNALAYYVTVKITNWHVFHKQTLPLSSNHYEKGEKKSAPLN